MNDIKLVIFDMDGVLIDSCEWHYVALNQALKEVCNYEINKEDHNLYYNGLATKIKLQMLNELGIVKPDQFEQIENLKQLNTLKIIKNLVTPKFEKIRLMEEFKSREIKLGCYTNSIRMTSELILKKIKVYDYLDVFINNQNVSKTKPDPEGYILCMNKLKIKPENCKILEDSPKGIQAAIASGAHVLKIKNSEQVDINLIEDILS
jgi:HAD superfamily hydrolase (TIGR01509 family)